MTASPAPTVLHDFTCPRCGQDWQGQLAAGHEPRTRNRICGHCRGTARARTVSLGDGIPLGDLPGRWVADALCAQIDPDVFFPEKGGDTRAAKAVCRRCPVIAECRDWALDTKQTMGIWGGLSARERERLLRDRRAAS